MGYNVKVKQFFLNACTHLLSQLLQTPANSCTNNIDDNSAIPEL